MSVGDNPYLSPADPPGRGPETVTTSARTVDLLRQTRPWVRFLGILGFIAIAFMMLAAFGMLFVGWASGQRGEFQLGQAIVMAVLYGVMAILYVFPSLFLLRYASRISDFLDRGTTDALDAALEAQKSFWKFVGIMVAVTMAIYVVVIGIGIGVGIFGAMSNQ